MIGVSSKDVRSKTAVEPGFAPHPGLSAASHRSHSDVLSLVLLAIGLGYAVSQRGGVGIGEWNFSLLLIGLAGLTSLLRTRLRSVAPVTNRCLGWAVLLFPCYIGFQLVPLPLPLMRILSPERAQLFEFVRNLAGGGAFVPLSIAPAITFAYLLRILGYTLTFLLVRDITSRSSGRRAWIAALPLILIAAMEAGFGLLSRGDNAQVQGTYANKNHFAGLLEMVLPLAVMYAIAFLKARHSKAKLARAKGGVMLCLAILIFLGLVYSMSKMGFVSGLFVLFAIGALAICASRIRRWKKSVALTTLAACLLFAFVFFPPDALIQAFGSLASKGGAGAEGRWPIWTDTLRLIAAYPLFGCGLGNYETAFLKYQTAIVDRDFTFAHNDYLQLAAELGAFGLIILATLMISLAMKAVHSATRGQDPNTRYIGLACVGGIAAMALHSFVDFNMYIPANAMVLAWICGMATGLSPQPVSGAIRKPSPVFFTRFAVAISCLLIVYASAPIFKHGGSAAAPPSGEPLEAVRRDAADPQRWCDLGQAMLRAGETEKAKYCFSRAVALGPNVPFILMNAADFHFALKDNRAALKLLARVLALDPAYQDMVFTDYERRGISADEVLRHGLPRDPRVFTEYLRRLIYQNRITDAAQTWASLNSLRYAADKLANEYVQFLIGNQDYEAAQQTWAHYVQGRDKAYPAFNAVFNGDFELDPAGCRFDWRIEPAQGAEIGFDQAVRHSGARSLRIQFDGTQNVSSVGVGQNVFLKPGRYRFEAYVRTSDVSTDEGVAFNVVDPDSPSRLNFTTESMLGTNDWKRIEREFQVPPGTGLIQVSLVRKPSLRFDNLIRGTVWVDGVSIRPEIAAQVGLRK